MDVAREMPSAAVILAEFPVFVLGVSWASALRPEPEGLGPHRQTALGTCGR